MDVGKGKKRKGHAHIRDEWPPVPMINCCLMWPHLLFTVTSPVCLSNGYPTLLSHPPHPPSKDIRIRFWIFILKGLNNQLTSNCRWPAVVGGIEEQKRPRTSSSGIRQSDQLTFWSNSKTICVVPHTHWITHWCLFLFFLASKNKIKYPSRSISFGVTGLKSRHSV